MMNFEMQLINEINNQILQITHPGLSQWEMSTLTKTEDQKLKEKKIELLSKMEALEEGFLLIKKI